jgi:L-asparaginase
VKVESLGTVGRSVNDRLLLLYTGGTIGMTEDEDGVLVPLDLSGLVRHLPIIDQLPVGVTLTAFADPIDSSAIQPQHWLDIADAIVEHAPGHTGVVVLHGTDTMAYTAAALSFLLKGLDIAIVLTGAQRPITAIRSDGRENLVTAAAIALAQFDGAAAVPEVTVFFDEVLLRGNRTSKVHADSYRGFDSPNMAPLATAGVTIEYDRGSIRPGGVPPLRRSRGVCTDVAAIRLHPALDEAGLNATLSRPGLRGLVIEAYGAGNGPDADWFLDALTGCTERGVVVVVTTQCGAGSVRGGSYATGAALLDTGAVPGADMTFEAAITKLMVLLDTHPPEEVRTLMQENLAGELTPI